MSFERAMSLVECDHHFPTDPGEFHNQRTAELFRETGLAEALLGVPLVVVTGSCGKASTARYLAECASELFAITGLDKAVGLGTKPPLFETLDGNRERYQILQGGEARWIDPEDFAEVVGQLPELGENLAPYDLRYWILGQWFVKNRVGLGIVEANIGFRRDPAAVFPDPVAQLLTPIGLDHVGMLLPEGAPESVLALGERAGPTWHKACALDPSRLVVSGYQDADIDRVVKEFHPEALTAGRDFSCQVIEESLERTRALLNLGGEEIEVELQTMGRHQAENAAQAACCLWALWQRGVLLGQKSQVLQAITVGLGRTLIPGRMERLSSDPVVVLNAATGVIKIDGMMTTLEAILEPGQTVWVCMSVLDRLVKDGIPKWLDTCLHRILNSPVVIGFTATAFEDDLQAETLSRWASERTERVEVDHQLDPRANLRRLKDRADLIVLVGQSQAELRGV